MASQCILLHCQLRSLNIVHTQWQPIHPFSLPSPVLANHTHINTSQTTQLPSLTYINPFPPRLCKPMRSSCQPWCFGVNVIDCMLCAYCISGQETHSALAGLACHRQSLVLADSFSIPPGPFLQRLFQPCKT